MITGSWSDARHGVERAIEDVHRGETGEIEAGISDGEKFLEVRVVGDGQRVLVGVERVARAEVIIDGDAAESRYEGGIGIAGRIEKVTGDGDGAVQADEDVFTRIADETEFSGNGIVREAAIEAFGRKVVVDESSDPGGRADRIKISVTIEAVQLAVTGRDR